MKYYATLASMMLLALPVSAQQSYPLGTYKHLWGPNDIPAQGWDPTGNETSQKEKDRMLQNVETFAVGLVDGVQPAELDNSGCPVHTLINSVDDVEGLPTLKLTGVTGTVYLIHDCDRSASGVLDVDEGWNIAVYNSAFAHVDYNASGSGGFGRLWYVDSLITGESPGGGFGTRCGGIECYFAYSEILGGENADGVKAGVNDTWYKTHIHSLLKGPTSHNDGIQTQSSAQDNTLINVTVDAAFQNSNAPIWISDGPVSNFKVAESLLVGGTHAFKTAGEAKGCCTGIVFYNSQIAADQKGTSFQYDACRTGSSQPDFQGDGNTATDGSTSGPSNFAGDSWNFDACNGGTVSQENKDLFANTKQRLETWRNEIRTAAGATARLSTRGATIQVTAAPSPAFSATPVTLSASVTGCLPAMYAYECGDGGSFDDGEAAVNSFSCGTLAPGSYTVGVRASGGSCEAPVSRTMPLTVSRPPAPEVQ